MFDLINTKKPSNFREGFSLVAPHIGESDKFAELKYQLIIFKSM
jgi:hypothetical protein